MKYTETRHFDNTKTHKVLSFLPVCHIFERMLHYLYFYVGVEVHFAESMESAVHMAASCAESDDTVLLAPACASLDQYDNYMARGDAFIAAVEGLRR